MGKAVAVDERIAFRLHQSLYPLRPAGAARHLVAAATDAAAPQGGSVSAAEDIGDGAEPRGNALEKPMVADPPAHGARRRRDFRARRSGGEPAQQQHCRQWPAGAGGRQ